MIRWVADTGPLLHLAEAGASHLIPLLGEVVLPPAVQTELRRFHSTTALIQTQPILLLNATSEAAAEDWCKAGLVHRGEAHAIALARQIDADYLLTDDAAARLLAASLGLRARGSLGIILWLAGQRRIGAADASGYLDRLASSSLWGSPRIMTEARAALQQLTGK
jgi:predicted nucleic acid-binding protein